MYMNAYTADSTKAEIRQCTHGNAFGIYVCTRKTHALDFVCTAHTQHYCDIHKQVIAKYKFVFG